MADKKVPGFIPSMPTAPPGASEYFPHRGPPPTYEESQKPDFPPRPPPSYYASVNGSAQSYNNQLGPSGQHFQQPYPQLPQPVITGFGAAPGSHMISGMHQSGMCPSKVIEFDAGARFRGQGSGSITVPPPPPGCAPTPAQLAALQGQPVILKKKKNSFF